MTARGSLLAFVIGALVASPPRAVAQPTPEPWAIGVSADDKARVHELLGRGNDLIKDGSYADAIDVLRQAIAIWDHPVLRYNIAVALINLVRPIEAYDELERALRFPDALEPEIREQALAYQRSLRAQIVELTIDCVDPGTRLTLDGNELVMLCPGSTRRLLQPGPHHLIASKPGSLTLDLPLVTSAGDAQHERIDLMTIEEATVTRRRWPRWKPWVVIGAGTLLAGVGLGVELQSAATYRSYDRAIGILCPTRPCTSLPGVVSDAYAQARTENQVAIGLFAVAGATLVTGAVLVWLDRSVTEHRAYERVVPTATIGSGQSTVGVRMAF